MQSKTLEAPESGQKERWRSHNPLMSVSFGEFLFVTAYSEFGSPKLTVKKSDRKPADF